MTNLIEKADRQQQRSWRGVLVAYFLLMVLLVIRHLFGTVYKEHGLNSSPLGIALLVVSIGLVVAMVALCIRLALLNARAAADPTLKEALIDNELVKLHITQSWKPAFIAAAVTPFVFLLIDTFHPIDDLLLVALTTPAVGSGAFLTSYHIKSCK